MLHMSARSAEIGKPSSTILTPVFRALPNLTELILMHPDYIPILTHIQPQMVPVLSRLSVRCTPASSISDTGSTVRKLVTFLMHEPRWQSYTVVLFGHLLQADSDDIPLLGSLCSVQDSRTIST